MSFQLPQAKISIADFDNKKEFSMTDDLIAIMVLKNKLNKTKTKLDNIYKLRNASKIMVEFNPFSREKYSIAKSVNAHNITVAWLKAYELIYKFNLIPHNADEPHFTHFDNAAFPGSFILAGHHLSTTHDILNYNWVASSLLNETNVSGNCRKLATATPLEDTFKLYANYPDNWIMHKNNNGDIGSSDNIRDIQKQLGDQPTQRSVSFYSCDLGIGVNDQSQYNNQEKTLFHLNICQIICGLVTLKPAGDMLVKHYTVFEPYTISYVALLTMLFEKVYITKPLTSKRTNSEIYIVCKNYLFPFAKNSAESYVYDILVEQADNTTNYNPLISDKAISIQIAALTNILQTVFETQIYALENYIHLVKNYNNLAIREECLGKLNETNSNIRKLFRKTPIKHISKKNRLNTFKAY